MQPPHAVLEPKRGLHLFGGGTGGGSPSRSGVNPSVHGKSSGAGRGSAAARSVASGRFRPGCCLMAARRPAGDPGGTVRTAEPGSRGTPEPVVGGAPAGLWLTFAPKVRGPARLGGPKPRRTGGRRWTTVSFTVRPGGATRRMTKVKGRSRLAATRESRGVDCGAGGDQARTVAGTGVRGELPRTWERGRPSENLKAGRGRPWAWARGVAVRQKAAASPINPGRETTSSNFRRRVVFGIASAFLAVLEKNSRERPRFPGCRRVGSDPHPGSRVGLRSVARRP